ncbi:MAG: glycosyltransferase family 2 protein [Bacteroides sp]|nr:glycosyltransferase family 2 protein [Bacteroides sp.]
MKISVIIPTYKPQDYLWECLNSLIIQTFPKEDFEIILVLNGCNEPYKDDIENYIAFKMQGMNVNFIHTDQGGVSKARNIALDNVKGEFITFIDDDDFVSPDYLKELYEKVSPDTIALCYPYAFEDGDMTQLPYRITENYERKVTFGKQYYPRTRKFFSGPCMKLIPMSFIQGRKFDTRFKNGEDSLFMFAISDKFKWVDFTSRNAVYYRRVRSGSAITIHRSKIKKIQNSIKMMIAYNQLYFSNPFNYNFSFYLTRILGSIRIIFN